MTRALLATLTAIATMLLGSGASLARPTAMPTTIPTTRAPAIHDGAVLAITEVGDLTLVGGSFTSASSPGADAEPRKKLLAFTTSTGALAPGFDAGLDGDVYALAPGPTPGTVLVGGQFTTAGGTVSRRVALLDATTGRASGTFRSPGVDGIVRGVEVAAGRVLIGGTFATVGGVAHSGLASLNPTTGRVDPYLSVQLTGRHNDTGTGAVAPVGAMSMDLDPDGTSLAVVGNFRKADGLDRVQAATIRLGPDSAAVTGWQTDAYVPLCSYRSFDTYMRGVAYSPDGEYFVIGTTGGGHSGTLCDAVARWDSGATGAGVQPTWVDHAGGDTILSVAVGPQAVYAGGHQRWMNNPLASDRAGAGAVPRPGLAALDPDSGLPVSWNPGRNPRGVGATAIFVGSTHVWVGSDTEWIGNYEYKRPRLAGFSKAGGPEPADESQLGLPGEVYIGSGDSAASAVLARSAFDGTDAGPVTETKAMGLDWSRVRGAFHVGGRLFYGWDTGAMFAREFDGSTLGPATELDPYRDPAWAGVPTGSGTSTYTGMPPEFHAQIASLTGLAYGDDRIFYTRSGDSRLYWRWFNIDSGIIGAEQFVASTDGWAATSGLTYADGTLWQVVSASELRAHPLDQASLGPPRTVSIGEDWRGTALFVGPRGAHTPQAVAAVTCDGLTCTANGDASTDSEGHALTYAWDFGDDSAPVSGNPAMHTYSAGGEYAVTLTVSDATGSTGTASVIAQPEETSPPVTHVESTHASSTAKSASAPSLSAAHEGDLLVLTGSFDNAKVTPAAPAGWTRRALTRTRDLTSVVWTKAATGPEPSVRVTVPTRARITLTLSAYHNVALTHPISAINSSQSTGEPPAAPEVSSLPGDAVVEVWSGRSVQIPEWTGPSGTNTRVKAGGTAGQNVTSAIVVDRNGGPLDSPHRASVNTTLTSAIAWSIVLRGA